MTSKLTITDERVISVIERLEHYACNLKWTNVRGAQDLLTAADGLRELQERRKAAMDSEPAMESEPVAIENFRSAMEGIGHIRRTLEETFGGLHGTHVEPDVLMDCKTICDAIYAAYGHEQPAPVVPDAIPVSIDIDAGYLSGWNDCRAAMLQENPKSAGESNNCRRSEKVRDLLAGNCRENGNSSTNNCREIAETSTGTAITPVAPDKKLTDDVLDEIIAGAKTSMEQYLALSLKAEREVWRKEGPTDDERIMAIEGIHNCERCGDEGWVVGEMGIMRCACGQAGTLINEGTIQAGNSPVITGAEQRIADAVELLQKAAPAMLADNSGPDGPLAGRLKSPVIPEGYVMVPKVPSQAHLNSIAMRYCHDFYLLNDAQKDSALATARQMYEECSGQGFYTLPAAPQEVSDDINALIPLVSRNEQEVK